MLMDVESRSILIHPLQNHAITIRSPRQYTAVRLRAVPHSTKSTYCLCTKLSTDVRLQPVTLMSISSALANQADLLFSYLEATNLLTGFSVYHLASSSVKWYWWVHNRQNVSKKSCKLISWQSRPIDRSEPLLQMRTRASHVDSC